MKRSGNDEDEEMKEEDEEGNRRKTGWSGYDKDERMRPRE